MPGTTFMIIQSMVKQKGAVKKTRYVHNFKQTLYFQCHIVDWYNVILKKKNVIATEIWKRALEYRLEIYLSLFFFKHVELICM